MDSCYPDEMSALGSRGSDVVEAAVLGEPIEEGSAEAGSRANDTWELIKHLYDLAMFVKCAVDLVFAARKDAREEHANSVVEEAKKAMIYIPPAEEVEKILEAIKRQMG